MAKGRKTGGRAAGAPNKVTGALREAIQNAFVTVGGEAYLVRVAQDDPRTFCKLLGMTLPKNVNVSTPGGLTLKINLSK